jgi:hypothetical protein
MKTWKNCVLNSLNPNLSLVRNVPHDAVLEEDNNESTIIPGRAHQALMKDLEC